MPIRVVAQQSWTGEAATRVCKAAPMWDVGGGEGEPCKMQGLRGGKSKGICRGKRQGQARTSAWSSHSLPRQSASHLASRIQPLERSRPAEQAMRWRRQTAGSSAWAHAMAPRWCLSQMTARTKAACARLAGLALPSVVSRYLMKYRCPLSLIRSTCSSAGQRIHAGAHYP